MTDPEQLIRHEQVWLLLPWLANGRLAAADREDVEGHVRQCSACERELAQQRLLCGVLSEPDRVIHAPGPSFRKLMARIEGAGRDSDEGAGRDFIEGTGRHHVSRSKRQRVRGFTARLGQVALWRPPGLAWAASFLVLFGITGMLTVSYYRWSDPVYRTHTAVETRTPNVLHIALDRSLTIAEVEELLHASGARMVEGPGSTGVFGVVPVVRTQGQAAIGTAQLRALAVRLRGDPRVLWVQPLADDEAPASPAPSSREP